MRSYRKFMTYQDIQIMSNPRNCIMDSEFTIDYTSSLSHCNVLSLDLNSSSTPNVLYASVDSPCISCNSCLTKSHDDMLHISCCHEINASISSSTCVANNVEESQHLLEQDMDLNGASSILSSSPSGSHLCLMDKDSKVSQPLEPSTPCVDEDEVYDVVSLNEKGEMVLAALPRGSEAISSLCEIMTFAIDSAEIIYKKGDIEREYADEIGSLNVADRKSVV